MAITPSDTCPRKLMLSLSYGMNCVSLPSCVTNQMDPVPLESRLPANMMTCVVYPPPLTICGKIDSAFIGLTDSVEGAVVVIKKSPRSLYLPRSPVTTTGWLEVILTMPRNSLDICGRNSLTNCAICPPGGKSTLAVIPVGVPSRFRRSRITESGEDDGL